VPVDVIVLGSGALAITAGGFHTCAITTAGALKCWGSDEFGQTGNGAPRGALGPIDSEGRGWTDQRRCRGVGRLRLHVRDHAANGVKCWGLGILGQLGDGTFGQLGDGVKRNRRTPVNVLGLSSGVAAISVGTSHACALVAGGEVRCWGLGESPSPVSVGTFAAQSIAFAGLPARHVSQSPFTVAATTTSGLAVDFVSLTPSVCAVSGSTVTLVEMGICSIAALQAGNDQYATAIQVTQTFLVSGSAIPRLGNVSTRAEFTSVVNTIDSLTAGFIIAGTTPKTVVVTARGPSLGAYGIANPNPNVDVTLYSASGVIEYNDNWQQMNPGSASGFPFLRTRTPRCSGPLDSRPTDPTEAAIIATLPPGPYTAVMTAHALGVAVLGVFEIDQPDTPLINVSARGKVSAGGEGPLIAGFVIQGDGPQAVAVVGAGPRFRRTTCQIRSPIPWSPWCGCRTERSSRPTTTGSPLRTPPRSRPRGSFPTTRSSR
jgi:hypothetical protein